MSHRADCGLTPLKSLCIRMGMTEDAVRPCTVEKAAVSLKSTRTWLGCLCSVARSYHFQPAFFIAEPPHHTLASDVPLPKACAYPVSCQLCSVSGTSLH
jgi:hypothetical protein